MPPGGQCLVGGTGGGLGPSVAFAPLGEGTVERQAEGVDDTEAEEHAEQPCPYGVGEGDGWRVHQEPLPAQCHVHLDGLHLEERADDAAHMKQLVAVTEVVEAAGGEALGQVCGEQEAGEEGQRCVPVVQGVGPVISAALTSAHKDPVEHRNVVKQVWVSKGQDA